MIPKYKIFLADIINPISDKSCTFIRSGALVLIRFGHSREYKVFDMGTKSEMLFKYKGKRSIEINDLSNMMIMPPFFDMHFHWVQDDVKDAPKSSLFKWLSKYTWPNEAKFKSSRYSKKKIKLFKDQLIKNGTLGGACFASIYPHTVEHALDYLLGNFVVGNVIMDMNSPNYLTLSTEETLKDIRRLSNKYKKRYALTPRFAITATPYAMNRGVSIISNKHSFIQTHLSETKEEIESVLSIYQKFKGFENVVSYTDVYDRCNLLGRNTLLGHGIYLSNDELKLIHDRKSTIVHCPTSNAPIRNRGLGSGLFDYLLTEKFGVNWVLGSDIGGGPNLSMFDVIDSFIKLNHKNRPSYKKGLYRATLRSAETLGIGDQFGNLAINKFANFLVVKSPRYSKGEDFESVFKRLLSLSNRSSYSSLIKSIYWRGEVLRY